MREFPIEHVQSRGATIGVENYSGPTGFSQAEGWLCSVIAAACEVYGPLAAMAKHRPVFAADLRGQTIRGSVVEGSSFTLDDYIADIEAVREHLGLEKIVLFGYSPGGYFISRYALAHPERVQAVVLVEPAIFNDPAELLQRAELAEGTDGLQSTQAMLSYIDPTLTEQERNEAAKQVVAAWQSPEAMAAMYRVRAENPLSEQELTALRQIPTLLIGGTESPMSFHTKKLAAIVPEAHVWWVQGVDHADLMHEGNAEVVARVIDQFLHSVEAKDKSFFVPQGISLPVSSGVQ